MEIVFKIVQKTPEKREDSTKVRGNKEEEGH